MAPMSDFVYPIIDEVSRVWVAGDENYDVAQHNARGMISATVYWRALIRNILPDGDHGIVVVFENACTDPFSYEVKGVVAVYLGVGDKHNPKYNRHSISSKLSELRKFAVRESAYTGAMLDEDSCPFTIHAYPSDHMRAVLLTTNPVMYAAIVLLIFAFVSIVFYFYDMKVERRQSMVMNAAVRSSAIVSSLFPSEVRDRIYPESEGAKLVESNKQNGKPFAFAKGSANKFTKDIASTLTNSSEILTGRPIAELYPETTVLFADICGFTSWSSERSPTQVFELLETLYAAFDAIAKRRGVFKVETIGDCYVAAVGLPTPRKQHAVVMARFAADCRAAMAGLLYPLVKTLGVVRETSVTLQTLWNLPARLTLPFAVDLGNCRPGDPHWSELGTNNGRSSSRRKVALSTLWRRKFDPAAVVTNTPTCSYSSLLQYRR
jgi:Adenylate and Guanylate cyclase catalytic domain